MSCPACLGAVILIVGFVIGINWWFRRGDQAVHNRIAGTRGGDIYSAAHGQRGERFARRGTANQPIHHRRMNEEFAKTQEFLMAKAIIAGVDYSE